MNVNLDTTTTAIKNRMNTLGNNTIKFAKTTVDNLPSGIKEHKKEITGVAVSTLSIISAITVMKALIDYSSKLKAKAKQ